MDQQTHAVVHIFNNMHWVDYTIIAIVSLSTLISLFRGFMRESLSLIAWGLAIWVALAFSDRLLPYIKPHVNSPSTQTAIAFAILFFATLFVMMLISAIIGKLVESSGLTFSDRFFGMFFGCARGILLVAVLLLVGRMTPVTNDPAWQRSRLVPHFSVVEQWLYRQLMQHAPEVLPKL